MKLKLIVQGVQETVEVSPEQIEAFVTASAARDPAHLIVLKDGSRVMVDTSHVGLARYPNPRPQEATHEAATPDAGQEADRASHHAEHGKDAAHEDAKHAETPADEDPGEEVNGDRTAKELKEALDAAGVEYPASARKADLVQLAEEHNV